MMMNQAPAQHESISTHVGDSCRACGEHLSEPHAPHCPIGIATEAALEAQDDTVMLADLQTRAQRRLR